MNISIYPLVSIIVPTHNRSALVVRALDSIFGQTFTDYEVIVVDDASTDDTGNVLRQRYGDRIVYIQKKTNEGLSAARNTGIMASHGMYVAFLDDDDEWLPEKIEYQMQLFLEDSNLGLVYCGFCRIEENGSVLQEILPEKRGDLFKALLQQNHITGSASAVLIKKEFLQKAGCFDEHMTGCEDWDLWIRLSRYCLFDYVDRILVRYHLHAGNMHTDMHRMELNSFTLIAKYRPSMNEGEGDKLFIDRCVYWAWSYYDAGCMGDFTRLLLQAISYCPLSDTIFNYGGSLVDKEKAFFKIFTSYWEQPDYRLSVKLREQAFSRQYTLLAWAYYDRGDLRNFRRCIWHCISHFSVAEHVGLFFWFLVSFWGKSILDRLLSLKGKM